MTATTRGGLRALALACATQMLWSCNAGVPLGNEGGGAVAPEAKQQAPAEQAAAPAAEQAVEAAPAPAPPPESPCVTASCHTNMLSGATLHPVAEGCDTCHEEVSTPHPAKGKKTFKLTQEPPDLCYSCHDPFGKHKTVHMPVESGMCTTCHNPHSSSQPKLLVEPVGSLCSSCHEDKTSAKVLHGPVSTGDCTACHNPHVSDTDSLLNKEGTPLCLDCHVDMEDVLKKKHVHAAVEAGCTSCHNPHGSKQPRMLEEPLPDLCFTCHGDIADTVKDAPVPHPAVEMDDSCVACHSPHSSDNDTLLLKPQRELCPECHDGIIPANAKSLHGPNNDGKCSRCHTPHGGKLEKLLVRPFPSAAYVPYSSSAFPLCFGCHKPEMFQYPETSFATNFRDGEKNLHYVHVHDDQKGRSCRLCHRVHGSPNPKLIADTVTFGQWKMPLKFVKTDTGGGCSPGCHNPRYYDRESPGRKPPKASAGKGD